MTSELFKSDANAVNTNLLMNLAYDYTTKDLDFKEKLALQREIMEKYTNFYNSLKEPGNELKGVNLVMPYDSDIGVLESVDDGFKHYMNLDYAEMKDLAEQFGYNYDNKKDRLAFLQMIEDRQHNKLHDKSKGGFLKRLARNLFLGNLDELIEADHKKDLYEKRHSVNPDRKLIDKGDFAEAYLKDLGFNALEFLNPLKFIKVAKKFPKLAQASYNVGLPASREAMYSQSGDREYNPLSVVMGAAANYGTPIMLQRASTRFGRRFDADDLTPAGEFKGWLGAQRAMKKTRERLDSEMKALGKGEGKLISGRGRGGTRVPEHWTAKDIDDYMNLPKAGHFSHVDKFENALEELSPKFKGRVWVDNPAGVNVVRKLERNIKDKFPAEEGERIIRGFAERTRERVPVFSKAGEKITDGTVHFLRKNPAIGEGMENYITNKLGREQFGGQFLNIAGGALGNVFAEDSDDTESLTDKMTKGMKKVYKKDIKDKYQIKPKDVEIIDKLIQNPQWTLGVGYPLEDHAKIRDIQLIYPDLFSEIQQKARGKEGGK